MKRLLTKEDRDNYRQYQIDRLREKGGHEQAAYDLVFVKYEHNGRPCVQIWKSGAAHSYANYAFQTEDKRQAYIDKEVGFAEDRAARKARKKLEQSNISADVKEGQIFYDSWGYDQTNIDFYKIQSVKGCYAVLVPIGQKYVESAGFMSERVKADPDKIIGEPIRRKILVSLSQGKPRPHFKTSSFSWAWVWDGQELTQTHYA